MKLTCVFFAISCLFLSVLRVQGGGSVTFQELESVTKSNPDLSGIFETMNIDESGDGLRLGRHFGSVGGARVGPYKFRATLKGGAKNGQPLELVLHTRWHLEDASGKRYESDPSQLPPADAGELKIVEVLERVELISLREGVAPSPTPAPNPEGAENNPAPMWNGTWDSKYGQLRLVQDGRRVYGDYTNKGYLEARTDRNKPNIIRGTYQYKDDSPRWGLFEFRLDEEEGTFSGSWADEMIPNAESQGWTGSKNSDVLEPIVIAVGKPVYWAKPYENRIPVEITDWIDTGKLPEGSVP